MVARPFDYDFRDRVVPDLRLLADHLASQVADGKCLYSQALAQLCLLALRRGAVHLSDFSELEDFLAELLADLADAELTKITAREA